jgi:hypothetical protein
MWNLVSICFEIVLVLVQDSCTVCVKRITGSEKLFWMHMMELLGDVIMWNLILVYLKKVLFLMQDRCTVCAERIIGS